MFRVRVLVCGLGAPFASIGGASVRRTLTDVGCVGFVFVSSGNLLVARTSVVSPDIVLDSVCSRVASNFSDWAFLGFACGVVQVSCNGVLVSGSGI